MQPNYQQPGYPAGYGQPAPQSVPPNYGGYAVPNAPQPQPAASLPQNLPQGDFADPRTAGGELTPKIRHMAGDIQAQPPKRGRTVIIEPLKIDEQAKGLPRPDGTVPINPCAYVNLTIVDGGPIEFGDEWKASRQVRPNTHQVNTPFRCMNMMIGNTWIVNAIRDALPPLGNGLLLGIIETGTQGNNPFLITKCEVDVMGQDRPDGAQRREAARQLWAQIKAGAFTNPTPTLLVPLSTYAPQGQPQPAYGPPQYQQAPQQVYGAPQGYVMPAQPEPSYAQQAPIQPQTASMVNAAAPAGLPPGFDVTQVPPGWDAGAWQPFAANPAQAAAIWANVLSQQGQPAQQPVDPNGQPYAAQGNPGW